MVEGAKPTNKTKLMEENSYFIFSRPYFPLTSVLAKRTRSRIKGFARCHLRQPISFGGDTYINTLLPTI